MLPYTLSWEFDCEASIISVSGTPNLSLIVAGTTGRTVFLLDSAGNPIWNAPFDVDDEVWSTSISEDGQFIAIGTANKNPADGTLYVLTQNRLPFWSTRIRAPIWNVKLSSTGRYLIATTWNNELFIFEQIPGGFRQISMVNVPGKAGLYGCSMMEASHQCMVASYDQGLYYYSFKGVLLRERPYQEGIYNIAYANAADKLFLALRDGCFGILTNNDSPEIQKSTYIAQRPICGISSTNDGLLVAIGSFDGRVIVTNGAGELLWDYRTKGEVWSTAISYSGATVIAGCGDHILRSFNNFCNCDAYREITAVEQSVQNCLLPANQTVLSTLLELYKKYRVTQYGYNKLREIYASNPSMQPFKAKLKEFWRTLFRARTVTA